MKWRNAMFALNAVLMLSPVVAADVVVRDVTHVDGSMFVREAVISRYIRDVSRELRVLESTREHWGEGERLAAAHYEAQLDSLQQELDEVTGAE